MSMYENLGFSQAQIDKYKVSLNDNTKKIHKLFDNVNEEDLKTLLQLFKVLGLPKQESFASYLEGYATSKLQERFNVNPWSDEYEIKDDDLLSFSDETKDFNG